METEFRKNTRLGNYDYAANGYYFVTVVTRNRLPLLKKYRYGSGAIAIAQAINDFLSKFISGLSVDYFVVMDDHIHVIFVFEGCDRTLGQIVKAMKYNITKIVAGGLPSAHVAAGLPSRGLPHGNAAATDKGLWQWNYYEHVIRNEKALLKIREYVQNNPEAEKLDWDELDG